MNVIELVRFYPDDDKQTVTRKRQRVAQILATSRVKLIKHIRSDVLKAVGDGTEKPRGGRLDYVIWLAL